MPYLEASRWAQEHSEWRREEQPTRRKPLTRKSDRASPADATYVETSSKTGENVEQVRGALLARCYSCRFG